MNDFTKGELFQLSAGISKLEIFNNDLHDKLQSMIENYCEHKRILEIRDVDYVKACYECEEVMDWE